MSSRLFVAIVPPENILEDLNEFLEPRREVDSPLRWVSDEQWHLTLAFMPAVHDRNYDSLVERLDLACANRAPFELQLRGAGAFPSPDRAKVLWTGIRGELEELTGLVVRVRNAATTSGVEVDGSALRPHLTLARVSRPIESSRWLRVLQTYEGPTWRAEEVELIQSQPGQGPRSRSRYHTLETFPLGSAAS